MGIRRRYLLYLAITTVVVLLLIAGATELTMRPRLTDTERAAALRTLAAAEEILLQEIRELDTTTADYATWDEMYAYTDGRNEVFIENTFAATTFSTLDLKLGAVLDADCTVIAARYRVSRTSVAEPPEGLLERLLAPGSALQQACAGGVSTAGMIIDGRTTYLAAIHPVHTSAGGGEQHGCVLLARELVSRPFREMTRVLGAECAPLPVSEASPELLQKEHGVVSFEPEWLNARKVMYGIAGEPVLVLQVRQYRDVIAGMQYGLFYIILGVGGVCLAAALAIATLLDRQVLVPLTHVGRFLRDFHDAGDLGERLPETGRDEVAWVAIGVNQLLTRFSALLGASEEARLAAEQSEQRFRAIFDDSPVSIVVTRLSDNAFAAANPIFYKRNPLTPRETLGQRPEALGLEWPEEARAAFAAAFQANGRVENLVVDGVLADGSRPVLMVSSVPIEWDGEPCVLTLTVDVSDRERAERALRANEEKLRLILEQTEHVVYDLDIEKGTIQWSGAVQRLLGYTIDEFQSVDLDTWADLIHPEDREDATKLLDDAISKVARYDVIYRFRRKDGTHITMEDIGTVLGGTDGRSYRMLGVMRDVTERQRVEDALATSEIHFRTLFESATDAIMLMQDYNFSDCNRQAEVLFGVPRDKIIGATPMDFSPDIQPDGRSSIEKAQEKMRGAYAGEPQSFEWTHTRPDGRSVEVEVRLNFVELPEGNYLQAVVRDVTERKRIESDLRQAQKMEAVGLLAGGVAHDFNNLLQAITGCGHLLLRKVDLDADGRDLVEELLSAAERAAVLTRQLLTFSSRQVIDLKPLDMAELLAEVMKMLRRLLGELVEVNVDYAAKNLRVKADRGQLEQVIVNLCINARDAMPGGGRITIVCGRETLSQPLVLASGMLPPGAYVKITFSDTGAGMHPETVARIFEPFFTRQIQTLSATGGPVLRFRS
ncbi:MAG: PAS domain S-box protein [Candidatus Hydrogenedens sp.]|nr:PAS domain S-box protein [Candidatus Hydrogenedens sp.]